MLQICIQSLFPTSRRARRELPGGVPTPHTTWRADHHPPLSSHRGARAFTACLAVALMIVVAPVVQAGDLNVPHSFTAGTPALAAQVNANFAAVETAVDDNDARVAALEALVVTLQSQNASQQAQIATLQSQHNSQQSAINAIQASNVMAIDPYVELTDLEDPNDGTPYATVRLSGVNLQVVDGSGSTDDTTNGLGNLIVGYNELEAFSKRCSSGLYDNQVDCEAGGSVWSFHHRSGSHNLILGYANNYSSYGGLVAGKINTVNQALASVGGGTANIASGFAAFVGGGSRNTASGSGASVSGGSRNIASNIDASVSGGASNTASDAQAWVSGGRYNTASGSYASVSGGHSNIASGFYSAVSGGDTNIASNTYASVSGGRNREAVGAWDWRAGTLFEND